MVSPLYESKCVFSCLCAFSLSYCIKDTCIHLCQVLWDHSAKKEDKNILFAKWNNWKVSAIFLGSSLYSIFNTTLWRFLICRFKDFFWLQAKSHNSHLNGFSPVCTKMCLFISLCCFIILLQKGHMYSSLPSFMGSFCKEGRQKHFICKMK